ncbi:putative phosphohydrolase [Desulfosporosinus orientis DSM 765]|uniref:Putative phosphohydrolase n=2 Tax=Desulfosporosinus orientis TaxID=1563 RepID=G7WH56_DESOD|nr:putative phosphohydrolase [Desulfosporosinus orientis DSM 765]
MWGIISSAFLGVYCLISFYIARRGWSIVHASNKVSKGIYCCCLGILVLTFPFTEIGQNFIPAINRVWVTTLGWYSMLAVVYIFLLLLLVDLVRMFDRLIKFVPVSVKNNLRTPFFIACFVVLFALAVLTYGTYNAQNPIITRYDFSIDKKASYLNRLRIVMVSDIHYGLIVDSIRIRKMVDLINGLQPDLILIGGDISEGTIHQQDALQLLKSLSQLKSKYGVFAVPGNHDRWSRDETVVRLFDEAGVNVLRDQWAKVADSLYIIGRDNPSTHGGSGGRKELEEIMRGVDSSLPLILLDHQPLELETAQQNQIDLQFSGHTHEGQIFPGNIITNLIYELDWGYMKKDHYHLIVSSGYGTWGPPVRIGTHSEIVCTTINFRP